MRFRSLGYRAHNPRWSWQPLSGEGASRHGGRFNPVGTPALYLSTSVSTALLEASQGFAFKMQPLTLVAYDVDCADIVDCTSEAERRAWRIDQGELACAWKLLSGRRKPVPSWQLAERLMAAGQSGILVPSFAPGATAEHSNLVLWRWSDRPPHLVQLIDDEGRLPRDASSWPQVSRRP